MINNAVWKPISGYEELYLVSNEGQVFSLISNKLLKQSNTTTGYKKVELTKQRRRKSLKVHRIVAKEFLANPLNLPIVNHLDGNPKNNNSTNLEWCDQKRNMQHAYDTGLIYSRLHRYKKELIEEYENSEISLSKLSEKYKVSIKSLGKMIKENGINIRTSSELRNIYKIDRAKLVDMIESGKSNYEIATFFGTNKKLIATYRCKYKKGELKI